MVQAFVYGVFYFVYELVGSIIMFVWLVATEVLGPLVTTFLVAFAVLWWLGWIDYWVAIAAS